MCVLWRRWGMSWHQPPGLYREHCTSLFSQGLLRRAARATCVSVRTCGFPAIYIFIYLYILGSSKTKGSELVVRVWRKSSPASVWGNRMASLRCASTSSALSEPGLPDWTRFPAQSGNPGCRTAWMQGPSFGNIQKMHVNASMFVALTRLDSSVKATFFIYLP